MVTVEDIEKEVAGSFTIRMAMNSMMDNLGKVVQEFINVYGPDNGPRICKDIILGKRKVDDLEKERAEKLFGKKVNFSLEMISRLNKAQKQYIFKRMGWDINEVE